MTYYFVLETDGLMPLRDTAHRSETERRQQLGLPIRCAHHNMKLALAAIAVGRSAHLNHVPQVWSLSLRITHLLNRGIETKGNGQFS